MKKQIQKKLRLSRETLRNLDANQLVDAAGGATQLCSGGASSCCTDTCHTCDCTFTDC